MKYTPEQPAHMARLGVALVMVDSATILVRWGKADAAPRKFPTGSGYRFRLSLTVTQWLGASRPHYEIYPRATRPYGPAWRSAALVVVSLASILAR